MEEKERFDVRSRDSAAKRRDEKRHLEKRIADAAARAREERQKFAQQLAEAATSAEAEVNAASLSYGCCPGTRRSGRTSARERSRPACERRGGRTE